MTHRGDDTTMVSLSSWAGMNTDNTSVSVSSWAGMTTDNVVDNNYVRKSNMHNLKRITRPTATRNLLGGRRGADGDDDKSFVTMSSWGNLEIVQTDDEDDEDDDDDEPSTGKEVPHPVKPKYLQHLDKTGPKAKPTFDTLADVPRPSAVRKDARETSWATMDIHNRDTMKAMSPTKQQKPRRISHSSRETSWAFMNAIDESDSMTRFPTNATTGLLPKMSKPRAVNRETSWGNMDLSAHFQK